MIVQVSDTQALLMNLEDKGELTEWSTSLAFYIINPPVTVEQDMVLRAHRISHPVFSAPESSTRERPPGRTASAVVW